jgi:hypothetical protein
VIAQHLDHVGGGAARRAAVAVGVYAESLLGLLHGGRSVQRADRVGVRLGLGGVAAALVVLAVRPVVALVARALVALVLGLLVVGLVFGLVLRLLFALGLRLLFAFGLRLLFALVFGRLLLGLGLVVVLVLEALVLVELLILGDVLGLGVVRHQAGVSEPFA